MDGTWSSTLLGYRSTFNSSNSATAFAGKFNVLLLGQDDAAVSPAGDGFLTLSISTSGRVSGRGNLADGSSVKVKTIIAPNGSIPIYVSLYGGEGSMFGWLVYSDDSSSDVGGSLAWIKSPSAGGGLYPLGFTDQVTALGAKYQRPPSGESVFHLSAGIAALHGGDLTDDIIAEFALDDKNRLAVADPNNVALALKLNAGSGAFTGTFVDPVTHAKRKLKGVVVPKANLGGGFFIGSSQSGRVTLSQP